LVDTLLLPAQVRHHPVFFIKAELGAAAAAPVSSVPRSVNPSPVKHHQSIQFIESAQDVLKVKISSNAASG